MSLRVLEYVTAELLELAGNAAIIQYRKSASIFAATAIFERPFSSPRHLLQPPPFLQPPCTSCTPMLKRSRWD